MTRYDDIDDRDDPQPEDLEDLGGDDDDIDEADQVRCPACGRFYHEAAEKCPHCGEWRVAESGAEAHVPGWLWPAMVGLLIAIILVMWHGLGR